MQLAMLLRCIAVFEHVLPRSFFHRSRSRLMRRARDSIREKGFCARRLLFGATSHKDCAAG